MDAEQRKLVVGATSGDRQSFEELVKLYERFIFGIVSKHGPKEEVEEIAQEIFLSAFRSISSLREPEAFSTWLHGIALRRCQDAWRVIYRKRRAAPELPEASDPTAENKLLLEKILSKLSPEDRTIMTLLYLEDRSTEEVGKLLGISRVNVKVRAHRIRRKLEEWL